MGNETSKEAQPTKDISSQLQKKLTKDQSLVLNLYIMGDKGTGKTALFNMLQRKRFEESYTHTPQNRAAKVSWEFRLSEVEVSINVWEIVQPRIKRKTQELKTKDTVSNAPLDTVMNEKVQAIVFMVDPRKKYTLEYVEREIKDLRHEPDILIVSNFADLCHDNDTEFDASDVKRLISKSNRNIKYCEASMSDRFGVKAIKTFMSIPFAKIEKEFLIQQITRVDSDIKETSQEFDQLSEEQDYTFYKDWLAKAIQQKMQQGGQKRAPVAEGTNTSPLPRGKTTQTNTTTTDKKSPQDSPKARNSSTNPQTTTKSKIKTGSHVETNSSRPPAQGVANNKQESGGFFSKIKSFVSSSEEAPEQKQPNMIKKTDPRKAISDLKNVVAASRSGKTEDVSIDGFDPSSLDDGNDYDCFFSDDEDESIPTKPIQDSDDEDFNPLVSKGEDPFGSDDEDFNPMVSKKGDPFSGDSLKPPKVSKSSGNNKKTSQPSKKKEEKVVSNKPTKSNSSNPVVTVAKDPFSSDDEGPNPLVAGGEDPFSDDEPNPLVDAGEDPFSSDNEGPNPLVAGGEDPFSDDDAPNPLVDAGEDPFNSDDEGPNPLVAGGEDPFSDDEPNPLVDAGEDPFSSDDEGPNPLVAGGEDPFSDDDAPNPLVDAGEDPFSSDDEGPNPFVTQGEDPFSDDE